MRVGLDAMGGDLGPVEVVHGAAAGLAHLGESDELVLFGQKALIEQECAAAGLRDPRISIRDCTQVITFDDSPVDAVRQKRDSSIVQLAVAAGKGELDAIISAGHTGAFAAACQFKIGPVEGVSRPGIAIVMPTFHGPVLICDVGANVAPKPHHLYEYALMCNAYSKTIFKVENPRIGLVSIGEEDGKGNPLIKETYGLLKDDTNLNFIGNVEGRDIFGGTGDVYICDGFTGNVVLKLTEGLAEGLFKTIFHELAAESPELRTQFKPVVDRIWRRHDFAEYGGAPLLGIRSIAIICHGRSDRRAFKNAVRVATEQIRANLNTIIAGQLAGRRGDAA